MAERPPAPRTVSDLSCLPGQPLRSATSRLATCRTPTRLEPRAVALGSCMESMFTTLVPECQSVMRTLPSVPTVGYLPLPRHSACLARARYGALWTSSGSKNSASPVYLALPPLFFALPAAPAPVPSVDSRTSVLGLDGCKLPHCQARYTKRHSAGVHTL